MEVKFKDLIDLAVSESENSETFIKNIYEWKHKIDMFLLQAIIGAIISLIIAGLYNYETLMQNVNSVFLLLFSIIILIILGLYKYFRLKENKDLFIASIKNYNNIRRFLGV